MGWVFQGNPEVFDIDDYLSRYPELVYWLTTRYAKQIVTGDRVFMWRAGRGSGAVAIGTVVERPTPLQNVKYPEALGNDLWHASVPDPATPRTGIHLEEVRLSLADGMVPRSVISRHPTLLGTTLIRMPTGTVFKLSGAETQVLEVLWGLKAGGTDSGTSSMAEGARRLRSHYVRERSSRLRTDKLKQLRHLHACLSCELCGEKELERYPSALGDAIFEVHHRVPLARSVTPMRTTLDDLAVLCANCHRVVHSSADVEGNFDALRESFARRNK